MHRYEAVGELRRVLPRWRETRVDQRDETEAMIEMVAKIGKTALQVFGVRRVVGVTKRSAQAAAHRSDAPGHQVIERAATGCDPDCVDPVSMTSVEQPKLSRTMAVPGAKCC